MGTHGVQGKAPSLVIGTGEDESNVLGGVELGDFSSIMVYSPEELDALDFTFYVHPERGVAAGASGWTVLHDETGTPIEPPAEGCARVYLELSGAGSVKIVASGNVAADRTWRITGVRTL